MHKIIKDYTLLIILILPLAFNDCKGSGGSAGNVIHIDPSAAASGNGSEDEPYKYWSEVTFQPGNTYAQKRGTIAREEIIIDNSGTAENPIIISAYGTGDNPIIQGSELETGWSFETGSIYSKIFDSSCSLGMIAQDGTALTFIAWDTNRDTTFTGASAGSFTIDYNTNTMYVWCTSGTPADHQIEVSRRNRGIAGQGISNVIIQNLKVQYVSLVGIDIGACGILSTCSGGETCSNVTIKNCTITKCGGIWFGVPYNFHLGNGIQFANGAVNCRVENCTITDIFDSGVSPQVYSDGQSQSGIVITETTIERCGFAGIEIAGLNNLGTSGSINGVTVEKVTISESGKGWSGDRSGEYSGSIQAIGIKIAADPGSDLSNITIDQSSVTGCKGHAVWLYGDTGTVTINRSQIFDNDGIGIAAMDNSTGLTLKLITAASLIYNNVTGLLFDVQYGNGYTLYNNTFFNNSNISILVNNNDGPAIVKNNIFSAAGLAHIVCSNPATGIIYNYNAYHGTGSVGLIGYNGINYTSLADFQSGTVHEDNGRDDDPLFADSATGNFYLLSGSPCIGIGDNSTGVTLDYHGNSYKNPPSMGAYEYY